MLPPFAVYCLMAGYPLLLAVVLLWRHAQNREREELQAEQSEPAHPILVLADRQGNVAHTWRLPRAGEPCPICTLPIEQDGGCLRHEPEEVAAWVLQHHTPHRPQWPVE